MNQQFSVWHHLAAAPHRSLFLVGALQGIVIMLWWILDLVGRYGYLDLTAEWSVASIWAHGFLMVYGFFPFFIFGFLFTTYPNWMNGKKIRPRYFLTSCLLLFSGVSLFYIGLLTDKAILISGISVMLMGWSIAFVVLLYVLITASSRDKRHAIVTSFALLFGWLGLGAYLVWLLTGSFAMLNFSRVSGIWFFLLPIVVTVSHRMIPFFSSRVLENYTIVRPYWILWLILSCSLGHGTLQFIGAFSYLWLVDFPLAFSALYLSLIWGLKRSFRVSLLAVLHISFTWLGLSMLLYGFQSLSLLYGNGAMLYGLAPLHGLGIGFFASMVLGMASRVTLGHSGRQLVLDSFTWLLFIGFQCAVVLRVSADVFPVVVQYATLFYLAAGVVWLFCFTLWAVRYAPIYWQQRIDGKSG